MVRSGKRGFDYILPLIVSIIFFADRLTKLYLKDSCFWEFCVRTATNDGAAFGIFPGQTLLFILAAIMVLIVVAFTYSKSDKLTRLGLIFIVSGTLSNFFDRLFYGYVTDVFAIFGSSSFNLADISNLAGAIILVFTIVRPIKR